MNPRCVLVLALALASACAGGGGDGGAPIDLPPGVVPEIIFIRSRRQGPASATQIRSSTRRAVADERAFVDRPGIESGLRVDPAGERVVFSRERTSGDPMSREIYVSRIASATSEQRLTADREADDQPCWSGDGTRVLFSSTRGGSGRRVWSVDPDSPNGSFETLFDDGTVQRDPDARGDFVVFSREDPSAPSPRAGLWLVDLNTGVGIPLTDGGTGTAFDNDEVAGDFEPTIAPDLRTVVFTRSTDSTRRRLMQVDLTTRIVSPYGLAVSTPGEDRRPRFSRSGESLFVARSAAGADNLRLVELAADGTDPVTILADKRFDTLGIDTLPALPPRETNVETRTFDLGQTSAELAFGLGSIGDIAALESDDGQALRLFTAGAGGRQVTGLRLRVPLPGITDPTDVHRIEFEASAAIDRVADDAIIRLTVEDLIDNRNDTVVEITPTDTSLTTITFTTQNLTYVSRDGLVSFTLIADLPDGDIAELAVDRVTVRVRATPPPSKVPDSGGG